MTNRVENVLKKMESNFAVGLDISLLLVVEEKKS